MAISYVVTEVNQKQGWVGLTVTWDDGTTYDKRMMAPTADTAAMYGAIDAWLTEYLRVTADQPDAKTMQAVRSAVIGIKREYAAALFPVERLVSTATEEVIA